MVGRRWLAFVFCVAFLGLSAVACSDAASIELACEKFCRCETPSPAGQETCAAQCEADLAGIALPQECTDCVALNECSDIEENCAAACQVAVPRMSTVDEEMDDEEID